jgi:hypothetical protein
MQTPKLKLSNIRFKAVIVGALVDNLGTMFSVSLLIMALSSTGLSESDIAGRLRTLSGLLLTLIIGLGWTMLGGYTAARMAKRDELPHGALVAAVGIVIALVFREEGIPVWFEIIGLVCMPPAGMAGGSLAKKGNART